MKSWFRQFFLVVCLLGITVASVDYVLDMAGDQEMIKAESGSDSSDDESPLKEKEEFAKELPGLLSLINMQAVSRLITDASYYFSDQHPGDHPVAEVPTPPPDWV